MKTYLSIWSGSNLSKSIRSGRNLWTIAQNASPFFQDEDMSRILTLGYPSVTLFAQTSSALAPFTAILNLYFWNFHNRHQRKESTRFYDNHWFETDTVRWWFDRLETILSLEERRRFGFRFITSAGLSWSAVLLVPGFYFLYPGLVSGSRPRIFLGSWSNHPTPDARFWGSLNPCWSLLVLKGEVGTQAVKMIWL